MGRILATLFAVSALMGCAFDAEETVDSGDTEVDDVQNDEGAEAASPPPSYDDDSGGDWSSNPCNGATGTVYVLAGREVFVPAECDPSYEYMGDPPDLTGDPGGVT